MSLLQLSHCIFRLTDTRALKLDDLKIQTGESWVFVGGNGSGKSALVRALAGELTLIRGEQCCTFTRPSRLSFEQLQKLVSEEWRRNNTDLQGPGEEDSGRTSAQIIQLEVKNPARCERLAAQLGISPLLNRRFKYLSDGETRKTLLCQALMTKPDLLILDQPFDGLDVASRRQLTRLLEQLHDDGHTIALLVNRFDQIPAFTRFAGLLADCTLTATGPKERLLAQTAVAWLARSEKPDNIRLPPPATPAPRPCVAEDIPRIVLKDGVVSYHDKPVIHHLNWSVKRGENWRITGPNGSGKSTLLSLISGDYPQGYSNDLTLFGRRRGSGETIQDIKQHIGYVSSSLHLDYRVSVSVRDVILSGYFDSIGIYQPVSDRQRKLAQEWLDLLGMDRHTAAAPFHSLCWGQQRLTLIARALVKHPCLLILDEPLQGLDPVNRQLIRRFVDIMMADGETQLLFVSHHAEDAPACITHRLEFVPEGESYRYRQYAL